jgi:phage FluMu protein gp41
LTIDTTKIEAKTSDAVAQAERVEVTNDQQYETVGAFLKGLKAIRNEIARTFDPIAKKLHAAHKEVVAQKKRHSAPVEQAERIVRGKVGFYLAEKERLRREAEDKLREQARKDEEKRKLDEALALEKEGKTEEAEAVLEEPVETPAVVIQDTTPKVDGISKPREIWKFRVVDESKVPDEYKKIDSVKLGGVVRATKGTLKIPGVEIYPVPVIAVKA